MSVGTTPLDRIVRLFVAEATDIEPESVIPANEPYPAPDGLYATVLRASGNHQGTPSTIHKLSPDEENVIAESFVIVRTFYSVNFYRGGAHQQAENLRKWCSSPLGIEAQIRHKVRIANHSQVRRLDAMTQESPEERAQIDIEIDTPEIIIQNLGRVRQVPHDIRLADETQTGETSNDP